uniref:NACHT domain-containing protein n=1 Tax=Bionectria ochroleuca TaxID=29856 RepID=A0A8H7KDA5_BIOOC
MDREKSLLTLALNGISGKLVQEIRRTVIQNREGLKILANTLNAHSNQSHVQLAELQEGVDRIQASQSSVQEDLIRFQQSQEEKELNKERSAILEWLPTLAYSTQHRDIIDQRQPGTGQWIFESPRFKTWLEVQGQTLFCPGIPGAGKTVLAASVIEHLISRAWDGSEIGVAYLYFSYQRQDEQKLNNIFGCLLNQLIASRPTPPESLRRLYKKHVKQKTEPHLAEILDSLHAVSAEYSRVFVVIDAVDEYQISSGQHRQFIEKTIEYQKKCNINLFATSRSIPEIARFFQGGTSLEIRATESDIQTYLENQMWQLPAFVQKNSELQKDIITEVSRAVQGMFLLAHLHLQSLRGKKSPKAVRNALEKLPTGSGAYDIAYGEAMERIDCQNDDQRELAKEVLQWVTLATRPLTTSEIQHAIAIEAEEASFDADNITEIHDMLSVCAGLVTVDEGSDIVRLVHYTAQEYFDRTSEKWFHNAQERILKACITCLCYENVECPPSESLYLDSGVLDRGRTFYIYAARCWGLHAQHLKTPHQSVLRFLRQTVKVKASFMALFLPASSLMRTNRKILLQVQRPVTGLHLAVHFKLTSTVKILLEESGPNLDTDSPFAPDPDARDWYSQTPLTWAAQAGREEIVKILLSKPNVNPNSKDRINQTPLLVAAKGGFLGVVKLLLSTKGIEPDVKDVDDQTPLAWAAAGGEDEIVKLLVSTPGVDVESRDWSNGTPLTLAAFANHVKTMEILLSLPNVDPNSRDNDERTPLAWAAYNGMRAAVELLLATPNVELSPKDKAGQTPVLLAARNGHREIVEMLMVAIQGQNSIETDFRV